MFSITSMNRGQEQVVNALHIAGCFIPESTRLKGGLESPFYIDQRRLRSYPQPKQIVVLAIEQEINNLYPTPDLLADVAYGITPLVSSLTDRTRIPQITTRSEEKDHGRRNRIEGVYRPGQRAVIIEDVVTTGG